MIASNGKIVNAFEKFGVSEIKGEDLFKVMNLGKSIAERKIVEQEKEYKKLYE